MQHEDIRTRRRGGTSPEQAAFHTHRASKSNRPRLLVVLGHVHDVLGLGQAEFVARVSLVRHDDELEGTSLEHDRNPKRAAVSPVSAAVSLASLGSESQLPFLQSFSPSKFSNCFVF